MHILIRLRSVNKKLLKARVFLREDLLQKTWMYISIACASFALHFIVGVLTVVADFRIPAVYEVTQVIFLMSFIIMIYQWYVFIASLQKESAQSGRSQA